MLVKLTAHDFCRRVGDRVSYEDMANPTRYGEIIRINRQSPWPLSYSVRWDDDGSVIASDLRQVGWRRETTGDLGGAVT